MKARLSARFSGAVCEHKQCHFRESDAEGQSRWVLATADGPLRESDGKLDGGKPLARFYWNLNTIPLGVSGVLEPAGPLWFFGAKRAQFADKHLFGLRCISHHWKDQGSRLRYHEKPESGGGRTTW